MPRVSNSLKVMLVWMDEKEMQTHNTYNIQFTSSIVSGSFEHINYQIDVNSYEKTQVDCLKLNEIASCKLLITQAIVF